MSFVITDLKAIKKLSEQNQEENFEFRSWLKFHSPKNLDKTVVVLSEKYFTLIDCKSCANCCRSLEVEIKQIDIERIAQETLASSMEVQNKFIRKNAENATCLKSPCPFLSDNKCSIYNSRPQTCRNYPYLEEKGFLSRLLGVISNCSSCPIVFNVYEELKRKYEWR